MKLFTRLNIPCLISFFFLICFLPGLQAQTTDDWQGKWDGAIEIPGNTLEVQIELQDTPDGWVGLLDIPVQRINDMELSELTINEDQISFKLPDVPGNANYIGDWEDGSIRGAFTQMGQQFALVLTKRNAADAARRQAKIERIKVLIDSFRQGADVPGLGVGIIHQEEILLAEGFGMRNLEDEVPVDADTRFAIGSSSKAFTTMGLALLAEEGKLDWEEPIKTYLPDFQLHDEFATREMTAVDLTSHRSGLPRHDLMWYATDFDRYDLYGRLRHLEPSASFRSEWQYQNLMYMTAGILTERLSSQTWEEYVAEKIFTPLGMSSANFSVTEMEKTDNFAYGYGEKEEEIERLPYHSLDAIGPAGSINASTNDMLKWVKLHLGDGQYDGQHFVGGNQLERMHSPQMVMPQTLIASPKITHPSYGLGWFLYNYDGLSVVEHGGNIDGFSALVFLIPDEGLGLVTLTNKNATPLGYVLAYTIADLLLDREDNNWYETVYGDNEEEDGEEDDDDDMEEEIETTLPPHPLEDYVGTYSHPGYGDVTVTADADELTATYYSFSGPLEHQRYDTFKSPTDGENPAIDVRFITDRNGQVEALYALMEASLPEVRFGRQPSERLTDPDFLDRLVGTYTLDNGGEVKISRRENKLYADIAGQPTYELEPAQGTSFRLKALPGFVTEFIMEGDKAVAVVSHQPNGDFRAERK